MNGKEYVFSGQISMDSIQIWDRATITLLDIRHKIFSPGEAIHDYRMPESTFIYTIGSKTEVRLDNTFYIAERFGLFHGGRGTEVSICSVEDWLEYYMISYKAETPPGNAMQYLRLLGQHNPFHQQYGFMPYDPLFFTEQLRKMYEHWKGATPLNLFYGKTAFYQLVYEIYEEIEKGNIHILEPDTITIAKNYLDEHFGTSITIQEMCTSLGISYSHFHRNFKKQTGKSPQKYLIENRLNMALKQLKESNATVREVADHCGFPDEYNFHRIFLKNIGMTPVEYREKSSTVMRDNIIENVRSFPYNEKSRVSHGKLKTEGENYMFKQMKSKAIVAAAVSLMLLLTACSTAPTNTERTKKAVTAQAAGAEEQNVEKGTRIVSTVMGDVEVPVNPKRVLVNYYTGDVLAFDVALAGVYDQSTNLVYYDEVKNIKFFASWDKESIMSLDPDLIIEGNKEAYDEYSAIAPVVVIPWDTSLEERIKILGDAFGKPELAAQLLAHYNKKVEDTKQELKNKGILDKTISIFEDVDGKSLRIFGRNMGRGTELFYDMFQMKASPRIEEELVDGGVSNRDLSFEVVPEYAGDIILHITRDEIDQNLNENPVWLSVPAVKSGNLIEMPYSMFGYNDILTQTAQIDLLKKALLALPIAQ